MGVFYYRNRKETFGYQWMRRERDKLEDWDWHRHPTLYKTDHKDLLVYSMGNSILCNGLHGGEIKSGKNNNKTGETKETWGLSAMCCLELDLGQKMTLDAETDKIKAQSEE